MKDATSLLSERMEIMMAKEGPFTPGERRKLVEKITSYLAAHGITDGRFAAIMGVSRSTWSQIRSGSYPSTEGMDKVLIEASNWLVKRSAQPPVQAVPYAPTSVGRKIMTICTYALNSESMGLIVAPAGCGKTVALKEFVRRQGSGAVYVEAGEGFSTKRALLVELALKLGLSAAAAHTLEAANEMESLSIDQLIRRIRIALAAKYAGGKGLPMVIVIDEATEIKPTALNVLRNLHDDGDCRAVVIIAGTLLLGQDLKHHRGRRPKGYEQLVRRCRAAYTVPADYQFTKKDVRLVADAVLASVGEERVHLDRYAIDYLHRLAHQQDKRLSNIDNRIRAVRDIARETKTNALYTVAQLDYAASLTDDAFEYEHHELPFGKGRGRALQHAQAVQGSGEAA